MDSSSRDNASNADAATVASGLPLPLTKPSDILSAAADLIEQPGKWQQHAWATNAAGEYVDDTDPDAVCFCASGAINRTAGGSFALTAAKAKDAFWDTLGEKPLRFNDAPGRTQAEVVTALRQAAEKARDSGQ